MNARTAQQRPVGEAYTSTGVLPPSPGVYEAVGYVQASEREGTPRAGFAAHLMKPVDLEQMTALIEGAA